MEPRDLERDKNRLGPDHLDQWLDAALHGYGSAEPQMGLEGRVLASLAAERARGGVRRWWWVYGAVAATACLGVVVWVDATHRPAVDYVVSNVASTGQKAGVVGDKPEGKQPVAEVQRRTPRPTGRIEIAKEPRLSQFPSPRALSEQEQLLVRYVTESPSEAVLVAKEQTERRKELEQLTGDEPPVQDSDQ
jgi:hypothetical protein